MTSLKIKLRFFFWRASEDNEIIHDLHGSSLDLKLAPSQIQVINITVKTPLSCYRVVVHEPKRKDLKKI